MAQTSPGSNSPGGAMSRWARGFIPQSASGAPSSRRSCPLRREPLQQATGSSLSHLNRPLVCVGINVVVRSTNADRVAGEPQPRAPPCEDAGTPPRFSGCRNSGRQESLCRTPLCDGTTLMRADARPITTRAANQNCGAEAANPIWPRASIPRTAHRQSSWS